MKLHKALPAKFYKTNALYEVYREIYKSGEREEMRELFVQCLSPIPSNLQEQFTNEHYIFEGLCSNKKNEKIFSELKKKKLEKQLVMFLSLL